MTYFEQLDEFRATYKISTFDYVKFVVLYPLFKLHFWLYPERGWRSRLADYVFRLMPQEWSFTVSMNFPALSKPLRIPFWLRPDRISSFREVFWAEGYKLKPGWKPTVFIDAGANAGYVCLYVAGHCAPKFILAIEANPKFKKALDQAAQTLAKQGLTLKIAMGAVVGHARELHFEITDSDRNSHVVGADGAQVPSAQILTVQGRTLRDWIRECGLENEIKGQSVFLKADIEGSEYEIFGEDPQLFDALDYLVMEVHGEKTLRDPLVSKLGETHDVLERLWNPSYPNVEIVFSEHR